MYGRGGDGRTELEELRDKSAKDVKKMKKVLGATKGHVTIEKHKVLALKEAAQDHADELDEQIRLCESHVACWRPTGGNPCSLSLSPRVFLWWW